MPKISVIMGVYNCETTLGEAIDSILAQTYTDWELILCDDGSVDGTYTIAQKYGMQFPQKIKLFQNEKNLGLNATLNRCLSAADGEYIARMDADDLCDPKRFEVEVSYLQAHSQIAFVSSDMYFFDEAGTWGKTNTKEVPEKKDFLYGTPFCHAPCMVRKEAYLSVNGYSESKWLLRVEDYHLWMKMYVKGYTGRNIPEPLYCMRDDRNAYHRRKFKYRVNEAYVKILAVKNLKLPGYGYLYALRPILIGLLPEKIYQRLHKNHLQKRGDSSV